MLGSEPKNPRWSLPRRKRRPSIGPDQVVAGAGSTSNAPASHLGPMPGRGSPRSSVDVVHAATGTSLKAELEWVMAWVSGPENRWRPVAKARSSSSSRRLWTQPTGRASRHIVPGVGHRPIAVRTGRAVVQNGIRDRHACIAVDSSVVVAAEGVILDGHRRRRGNGAPCLELGVVPEKSSRSPLRSLTMQRGRRHLWPCCPQTCCR